jgi:hypothetical protein
MFFLNNKPAFYYNYYKSTCTVYVLVDKTNSKNGDFKVFFGIC